MGSITMTELKNNIDPAEQSIRISICVVCENNITDPSPTCQLCNKNISVLTSEEQEVCPLNKWSM